MAGEDERAAARHFGISRGDIEAAVKTMLEHMAGHLAGGGRIEIRDFGSFSVRYCRARLGRNPRTGAPVARSAGYAVHFRPGKALREGVDTGRGAHGGEKDEGPSVRSPTKRSGLA